MEPRRVNHEGRELGNAAAAAMLCVDPSTGEAILPSTYQWYVRVGKPAGNKAPEHVWVDTSISPPQRMYPLDEVREWQRKRRGRGNWGGIGAKARRRIIGHGACPECAETVNVDTQGLWAAHGPEEERCPRSGTAATHYVEGPPPVGDELTDDDLARLDVQADDLPADEPEEPARTPAPVDTAAEE